VPLPPATAVRLRCHSCFVQRLQRTQTGWNDWRARLAVPGILIFGFPLLYVVLTGHTRFADRTAFVWTYGVASLVNLALLAWALSRWTRSR
jgi:hypothetical protein